MKSRLFAIALSLLPSLALAAAGADHQHHNHVTAPAQASWAQGTLKKVDQAARTAVIAHGPIDSIGMAPMTMKFTVRDASGLARLKDGDKVRFQAVMAGGDVVVTHIEAAK